MNKGIYGPGYNMDRGIIRAVDKLAQWINLLQIFWGFIFFDFLNFWKRSKKPAQKKHNRIKGAYENKLCHATKMQTFP